MSQTSVFSRSLVLGLAVVAGVVAESAAQTMGWRPDRTTVVRPTTPVNPYGRLFLLPGQKTTASAPRLKAAPAMPGDAAGLRPTVVCGTRLVPIDPSIDPGIRRLPDTGEPRPAVRAVDPPLCR